MFDPTVTSPENVVAFSVVGMRAAAKVPLVILLAARFAIRAEATVPLVTFDPFRPLDEVKNPEVLGIRLSTSVLL